MASRFTASGVSFVNASGNAICYESPSYPNPSGCSIVLSCLVSNTAGDYAPVVTTSVFTDTSLTSVVAANIPLPSGASLELIPNKLILLSGQSLQTTVNPSGSIFVTTSVLEQF